MKNLVKRGLIFVCLIVVIAIIATTIELIWQTMFRDIEKVTGTLEEVNKREIYTEDTTRVKGILVKPGDRIHTGQLLATLETNDYAVQHDKALLNLEQAQLNLEKYKYSLDEKERTYKKAEDAVSQAEKALQRTTVLYNEGVVSKDELELYQSKLDAAKDTLEDAKDALRSSNIDLEDLENKVKIAGLEVKEAKEKIEKYSPDVKSPIDGVVTAVNIKEGEFANPSQPIVVVSDITSLQAKVNIRADDISKIELGQKVEIKTDIVKDRVFYGEVDAISPLAKIEPASQDTQTFVEVAIKVLDKSSLLMSGFPVETKINTNSWSHQVNIADTSMLPDTSLGYVSSMSGDQLWTVYSDRIDENLSAIFLQANDLVTGNIIQNVKVSGNSGSKSNPGIIPLSLDKNIIYWQGEENNQKFIEYSLMDKDFDQGKIFTIIANGYSLINPVTVVSDDNRHYIAAIRKTSKEFGFYIYEVTGSGFELKADTGTVLLDDSQNLGFRDVTPSILDICASKTKDGFVITWVERESYFGHIYFIRTDNNGNILIPKKEIYSYYLPAPYRNNSSVEFLPDSIHIFMAELNNPVDRFFQISKLITDYQGEIIESKEVLINATPDFRGAVNTAQDAQNNIHIVWIDQDTAFNRLNSDIFYRQLDDKGNPMTPAKILVGKINTQKYPELFILPDGNKVLAWIDLKGKNYALHFKSTHPKLSDNLKKTYRISDIRLKIVNHTLNLLISLASAVLLLIPLNLLPIMLFCLFLYTVIFKKLNRPLYYLLFLLLTFPLKYFNGIIFQSIFSNMINISHRLLLAINAATLSMLAAVILFYFLKGRLETLLDRFSFLFAGWLYLDTVCIIATAFYKAFGGGC